MGRDSKDEFSQAAQHESWVITGPERKTLKGHQVLVSPQPQSLKMGPKFLREKSKTRAQLLSSASQGIPKMKPPLPGKGSDILRGRPLRERYPESIA